MVRKMPAQSGISKSTVQHPISRFKTHGTVYNLPKIGRPRKPPAWIDAHIVRVGEKSEAPSAVDIAKQLAYANIVVLSPDTVNMRLNESGLEGKVMVKIPIFHKKYKKLSRILPKV